MGEVPLTLDGAIEPVEPVLILPCIGVLDLGLGFGLLGGGDRPLDGELRKTGGGLELVAENGLFLGNVLLPDRGDGLRRCGLALVLPLR